MKRQPGLLLAPMGLVLAVGLVVALRGGSRGVAGPVYTVAQVQAGLMDRPPAWVGPTIWVRGLAAPCPWRGGTARLWQCADDPFILVADPADPRAAPLPLSPPAPDTLLAVLQRLPLLHALAARSLTVPIDTPARFRVQVQRLAAQACGSRSPCYEAVPRDIAP
jgi:hypothetical protein